MLQIHIPGEEFWNDETEEFVSGPETVISLEHSLNSISKWESKWRKSFFSNKSMTNVELLDYIKCMTITPNVDDSIYNRMTSADIDTILEYMHDPMTATTITEKADGRHRNSEIITSEIIYYWMVSLQIPFECQEWHINRLITLIRVCSIKNQPDKKMGKRSVMQQNAALNAARRKKLHSRG